MIFKWLIDHDLLVSLLGASLLVVEYLKIVFSCDTNSLKSFVGLVEWLNNTLVVILCDSSVLHQLDVGFAREIS